MQKEASAIGSWLMSAALLTGLAGFGWLIAGGGGRALVLSGLAFVLFLAGLAGLVRGEPGAAHPSRYAWQVEPAVTTPAPLKRIEPAAPKVDTPPVNYYAYLASAAWKDKRRAAIARADGRCMICNSRAPLEAHHRTYDRLGDELDSDLVVLCGACHRLFHANGRIVG